MSINPGLFKEGVKLREPKEGGCEQGGETANRGTKEKQDRENREQGRTIPGSMEYLGAKECRHRRDSAGRQNPCGIIGIRMGIGYFIMTLNCDHCE